jgi:hypothetical protein
MRRVDRHSIMLRSSMCNLYQLEISIARRYEQSQPDAVGFPVEHHDMVLGISWKCSASGRTNSGGLGLAAFSTSCHATPLSTYMCNTNLSPVTARLVSRLLYPGSGVPELGVEDAAGFYGRGAIVCSNDGTACHANLSVHR